MRDITKSVFGFSWAMSLFGVQQIVNLISPTKATKAFDSVTHATEAELADIMKETFKMGDKLQKGMVDLTFDIFTLQAFNPSRMVKMTSDIMQQSAEVAQRGMKMTLDVVQPSTGAAGKGAGGGASGSQTSSGWGPVR